MAAQGQCPGCGAPIEFKMGSSISAVCQYCNTTVRRSDRGLENLGKIAAVADTPSIVAVGDSGSIGDQGFQVLGKVQLNHDMGGVWDEWYLGFSNGQWGWLAYAQGMFMVTWKVEPTPPVPPMNQLGVEYPVDFGQRGTFRVVELKQATIASAEGELPFTPKPGETRYYADLHGPNSGFGTIDWGQGTDPVEVFLGYQLLESQLRITQQVERPERQIDLEGLNCPGCGAPIKLNAGKRIERVACQYCGTISESASQQIIARQEAARAEPLIPLGSAGMLENQQYTVIGFVQKSTYIEGETFTWSEYLLFGPGLGFRWLVDDEGTWRFVSPVNAAEVDLSQFPSAVSHNGRSYQMRNQSTARTDYVLGEFYWKVQIGETTQNMDFASGSDVLSREFGSNEVHWSFAPVIPWASIAQAFNVQGSPGAAGYAGGYAGGAAFGAGGGGYDYDDDDVGYQSSESGGGINTTAIVLIVIVIFVLIFCGMCVCVGGGSSGGSYSGSSSPGVRGGPVYGGGWSSGK